MNGLTGVLKQSTINEDGLSQAVGANRFVQALVYCARPNFHHGRGSHCRLCGMLNPLVRKYDHDCMGFRNHRRPLRMMIDRQVDGGDDLMNPTNP